MGQTTTAANHHMPAMTLHQPWASLLALGVKPFETRSWSPIERYAARGGFIGQRIAIHAGLKRIPPAEYKSVILDVLALVGVSPRVADILTSTMADPPHGAVLATGTLIGAHQVASVRDGAPVLDDGRTIRDDLLGDYAEGRWCWEFGDMRQLKEPVPAKGYQGIWSWWHDPAVIKFP
jgi:hypothetical protein